jgi:NAD(P)H-nitrite reductase large subunit
MITRESDQPYDRPNLSKDFVTGEAKPEWLPLRSPKFYADQRIEVLTNTEVTSLDPRARTVTFRGGETLSFDKALIATGGTPRISDVPGADGEGCFTLRSFSDARSIVEAAAGAKRAVLVGSGFIGLELASSLCTRGLEVEVVSREELPLAHILGERIARYLKRRHEQKNVTFHMGATVDRISGAKGAKTVTLSGGKLLNADFVVFGLGVKPALDFLAGFSQPGIVRSFRTPREVTRSESNTGAWRNAMASIRPGPCSVPPHPTTRSRSSGPGKRGSA